MTSVQINKSGTDQTTIEFMQTGSSETSVSLRHNLLDDKLNYMFTVSNLSVPLNNAPISPVKTETELFRVMRRNVGLSVEAGAGNFVSLLPDPNGAIFTISPDNKFSGVSELVRSLTNWGRGFNRNMSLLGMQNLANYGALPDADMDDLEDDYPYLQVLPPLTVEQFDPAVGPGPYNLISFKITPDGSLEIVGTPNFWNNFVLQFTDYGANVLGLQDVVINRFISYSLVGGEIVRLWYEENAPFTIRPGELFQEVRASASHPLYQVADQRVKISVTSHLPMASNIVIIDQTESVDRTIAEKYFENKLETIVSFDDDGVFSSQTLKNILYSGQVNFIKKSDVHTEWFRLLTAFELRYMRYHLNIHYREWSNTTNTWVLTKRKLEVPENKYWEMSIRFVSDA